MFDHFTPEKRLNHNDPCTTGPDPRGAMRGIAFTELGSGVIHKSRGAKTQVFIPRYLSSDIFDHPSSTSRHIFGYPFPSLHEYAGKYMHSPLKSCLSNIKSHIHSTYVQQRFVTANKKKVLIKGGRIECHGLLKSQKKHQPFQSASFIGNWNILQIHEIFMELFRIPLALPRHYRGQYLTIL